MLQTQRIFQAGGQALHPSVCSQRQQCCSGSSGSAASQTGKASEAVR